MAGVNQRGAQRRGKKMELKKNKCRSISRSMERRDRHRSTSIERRRSPSKDRLHSRRDRSGSRIRRHRENLRNPRRERSRRDRSGSRQRSRSRSRERSQRHYRDRSRSRSRDRSERYHRDRKSRSRSTSKGSGHRRRDVPRNRSRERSRHDYIHSKGRSKSRSSERRARDRSRDDDRKDQHRSDYRQEDSRLSPNRRLRRSRSNEERRKGISKRVERDQDWAKLIPDYDSLTPAEKVKAKMKLQLSQTVIKDSSKGVTEEWERFDFNKDAPLDGDAKQDYFGDGTGAANDTAQLDNLGASHLVFTEQARREAQLQAAHEAAIFGAPVVEDKGTKRRSTWRVREDTGPSKGYSGVDDDTHDNASTKVYGVVSEQIIALQTGSSWQDRIKKMRAAQAQGES